MINKPFRVEELLTMIEAKIEASLAANSRAPADPPVAVA